MGQALKLVAAAAITATAAWTSLALAQADYPNRVVKVVVPYGPGSVPDILARGLAAALSGKLGPQVIVENRAGASGTLGTASVVRAGADGYTLLFTPALVLSVLPQLRGADAGYKPDALTPVCRTFINTMGLTVRPESLLKSIGDLVAAAKQRPGTLN